MNFKKVKKFMGVLLTVIFLSGVLVFPASAQSSYARNYVCKKVSIGQKVYYKCFKKSLVKNCSTTDANKQPQKPEVGTNNPGNVDNNNQTQKPEVDTQKPEENKDTETLAGLTADEKEMLDLVNKERTALGLKPLQIDMEVVKLARMKSKDMIDKNYFSHTSPTYGSPFEMLKNYGVTYRMAGENLAGAPNVQTAHKNLMQSQGHRENILRTGYTHVGIGIVDGGPYGKMFTQLFIQK